MAKQTISAIERHVEKGVLAVTVLALLAVVAMYVVRSPNKVVIDGVEVGPGELDRKVVEAATQLRKRVGNVQPEKAGIDDPLPRLEKARSPLAYARVPAVLRPALPPGPRIPRLKDAVGGAGNVRLATALPPGKPKCTTGRNTIELPDRTDGPVTVNWVTVAATFDRRKQIEQFTEAHFRGERRNAFITGTDLQRREVHEDESTTEWVDVETFRPHLSPEEEFPPLPEVHVAVDDNGIPIVSADEAEAVEDFRDAIVDEQVVVLRPLFPTRKYGRPWQYPKFDRLDVSTLDRDFMDQLDPRPYPPQLDQDQPGGDTPTPGEQIDTALNEVDNLLQELDEGQADLTEDQLDAARQRIREARDRVEATASQIKRAEELIARIDQAILDLRRAGGGAGSDDEEETEEDAIEKQAPVQVVWALDLQPGSVTGDRTYQYRLRLRLLNAYCALPGAMADPQDAAVVEMVSDWSEASDPIHVEPDTAFFLTKGNPRKRTGAKVEVFKWFEGAWVTQAIAVKLDQKIAGRYRKAVRLLPDGNADRPRVDFDTGVIPVDLTYGRPHRQHKINGADGVEIDSKVESTVAMVYLTRDGDLRERLLGLDKTDVKYKHLKSLVFDERKAARKVPPSTADSGGSGGRGGGGRGGGGRGGGGRGGGGGKGGGRP